MASETKISWADMTHNHWIGCARVSPACDSCYAAFLMETRMGRVEWGGPGKGAGTRDLTSEANRRKPYIWDKQAKAAGTRPFVFCSSLSDVFDNQVPDVWRMELFDTIRNTPNLVWLLLTKRPQLIARLSAAAGGLPPNAAIGTTVEDQKRADINVPALLEASEALWRAGTKPLFSFLSCEPLLGPVDLRSFNQEGSSYYTDALTGRTWIRPGSMPGMPRGHIEGEREYVGLCHSIKWVIAGGETDQGKDRARPTHPDWFRSLRDQCKDSATFFHFKQHGNWASVSEVEGDPRFSSDHHVFPDGATVRRVPKDAPNTLDGIFHLDRPKV